MVEVSQVKMHWSKTWHTQHLSESFMCRSETYACARTFDIRCIEGVSDKLYANAFSVRLGHDMT